MNDKTVEESIFQIDPQLKKQMWREMVEAWLETTRKEMIDDGIGTEEIEKEIKKLKKSLLRRKD